jgi:hypothetical protein
MVVYELRCVAGATPSTARSVLLYGGVCCVFLSSASYETVSFTYQEVFLKCLGHIFPVQLCACDNALFVVK